MMVIYLYVLMILGTVWDRGFLEYLFVSFLIAYFLSLSDNLYDGHSDI